MRLGVPWVARYPVFQRKAHRIVQLKVESAPIDMIHRHRFQGRAMIVAFCGAADLLGEQHTVGLGQSPDDGSGTFIAHSDCGLQTDPAFVGFGPDQLSVPGICQKCLDSKPGGGQAGAAAENEVKSAWLGRASIHLTVPLKRSSAAKDSDRLKPRQAGNELSGQPPRKVRQEVLIPLHLEGGHEDPQVPRMGFSTGRRLQSHWCIGQNRLRMGKLGHIAATGNRDPNRIVSAGRQIIPLQ